MSSRTPAAGPRYCHAEQDRPRERFADSDPAGRFSLSGAVRHVLTAGDRFDVEKRKPLSPS